MQSVQASFRTTLLTASPGESRTTGAKIDWELTDGIAGVAVTVPPVVRKKPIQSPAAAIANATNASSQRGAADLCGLLSK